MPHSLRAKLSGLRYKGILEDKDYKRLCKALDNEDVLEQIRAQIEKEYNLLSATRADETLELGECLGLKMSLKIIDKYRKGEQE